MSLYLTQLKASLFSKQCVLPYNKGTGNDAVYLSWQGYIRKQESLEKQLEKKLRLLHAVCVRFAVSGDPTWRWM